MTFRTNVQNNVQIAEYENEVLWTIPLRDLSSRPEYFPDGHPMRSFVPLNGVNRRALIGWMQANPPWKPPAPLPETEPPTFWERLLDG